MSTHEIDRRSSSLLGGYARRRDWAALTFALLLLAVVFTASRPPHHDQIEASAPPTIATVARFELDIDGGAAKVERTVSAGAAVQTFLQMYRMAGPRLGCRFIDASTILTLAGARALTAWNGHIEYPSAEDLRGFDKLNRWLVPQGISLQLCGDGRDGRYDLFVVSLAGLERVSHTTRIHDVEPYDSTTAWRGYYDWIDKVSKRLFTHPPVPGGNPHVLYGVQLGYPDRAILDYLRAEAGSRRRMISSDTPWTRYYECGEASFSFPADDCNDATIVATEREWGDLLEAIYTSPEMRSLDVDPAFRNARRALLASRGNCKGPPGWWSDERERLGLRGAEEHRLAQFLRCTHLKDSHERLLRLCARDLAQQLRAGASADDLLKICRNVASRHCISCDLSLDTLIAWISRARNDANDAARGLYDAARSRPSDWCRRAIEPVISSGGPR